MIKGEETKFLNKLLTQRSFHEILVKVNGYNGNMIQNNVPNLM